MLPAALGALLAFFALRWALTPLGIPGVAIAEWIGLLGVGVWLVRRQRGAGRVGSPGAGGLARWSGVAGPTPILRRGAGGIAAPQLIVAGAMLAGVALAVVHTVARLQAPWVVPEVAPGPAPALGVLIFAVVVTPAICEEFVFRGLVLQGIRARSSAVAAIFWSGVLFGLFHWAPGGEFRLLPLAAVGWLFAWAVSRSGSLLPSVVAHAAHNGALIFLAGAPVGPASAGVDDCSPLAGLPLAFIPWPFVLAGGLALFAVVRQLLSPSGAHASDNDPLPPSS